MRFQVQASSETMFSFISKYYFCDKNEQMNNNDKTLNSPCLISGRSPSNQGKSYRMYINLKLFKDVLFLKLKFNNKCYDDIKSIFSLHIVPLIRSYD